MFTTAIATITILVLCRLTVSPTTIWLVIVLWLGLWLILLRGSSLHIPLRSRILHLILGIIILIIPLVHSPVRWRCIALLTRIRKCLWPGIYITIRIIISPVYWVAVTSVVT